MLPSLSLVQNPGTTSSRAILFDHSGAIVVAAQQEFPRIYPSPGLVEHDPEAIWSSQLAVAQEVMKKAGASARDVAAIGIANQRETAIVWDKTTGKPVFNAIVWQSRLTVPIGDALKAKGIDKEIRERTGLVTDAYFSGTKVNKNTYGTGCFMLMNTGNEGVPAGLLHSASWKSKE